MQESFYFVKYRRTENQLIVFADDTNPRWLTCATMLDFSTMAGADKFGNVCMVSTLGIMSGAYGHHPSPSPTSKALADLYHHARLHLYGKCAGTIRMSDIVSFCAQTETNSKSRGQ